MKFVSSVRKEAVSFFSLLSSNAKLEKTVSDFGVNAKILGLPLAPSRLSGRNVCAHASAACVAACVGSESGRKVMPNVRQAMIARTLFFFEHQKTFFSLLRTELESAKHAAEFEGSELYFRPNEASDIPWERFSDMPWICKAYDYTAIHSRAIASLTWSLDYQLTFSVKETTPWETVRDVLDHGGNVAIVVDTMYNPQQRKFGVLPNKVLIGKEFYETVDGDIHDLRRREIDGQGKVILLRLKGTNKAKETARRLGFARPIENFGVSDTFQRCDIAGVLS